MAATMALVLLCLGGLTTLAQANTGEVLCAQLAERKYFIPAADCYQKEAKKIPHSANMKEDARLRKGGYLREAARNLDRAAGAAKKAAVAAKLREDAVAILQRVLTLKLVRRKAGKRRGRLIKIMLAKIKTKIGYTALAISTAAKGAQIEVSGYKFKAKALQKYNQSLRPGPYTVRVKYSGEKVWRTKKFVLTPGKPVVLTFVSRPPVPALSWIGYTIGAAAIIGGGVMLGYGLATINNYNACLSEGSCNYVKSVSVVGAKKHEGSPIVCLSSNTSATCRQFRKCLEFDKTSKLKGSAREAAKEKICGSIAIMSDEDTSELYTPGVIFTAVGASSIAVGATLLIVAIVAHSRSRKADIKQKAQLSAAPATQTYTLLSTHTP